MKAEEIRRHKGKGLLNKLFGGSTVEAFDEVKRLESNEEYEACLKVLNALEEDHPEKRKEIAPKRRRIQLRLMGEFLKAYSASDSVEGLGLDDLNPLLEQVETFLGIAKPAKRRQLVQLRGRIEGRQDKLITDSKLTEVRALMHQDKYVDAYLSYVDIEDRLSEDVRSSCRARLIAGLVRQGEEHESGADEQGLNAALEIAEMLLSLTGEDRYLEWQKQLRGQLTALQRLKEAQESFAEARYDLALTKVRQLLHEAPDHPEGRRLQEEILGHLRAQYLEPAEEALQQGEVDDAERTVLEYGSIVGEADERHRALLERCTGQRKQAEAVYQGALAHYRAGEWSNASQQLDACLKLHREHSEAKHLNAQLQGITSFVGGDPRKLRTFRQAVVRIGRKGAAGAWDIAFSDRFLSRSASAQLSYERGCFVLEGHGKIELTCARGTQAPASVQGKTVLEDRDRIGFSPLLRAVFKTQGSLAKLIFSPVDLKQIKPEYQTQLASMVDALNRETGYVYLMDATGKK